jgi:UDPglucose 6-dehydrogenase
MRVCVIGTGYVGLVTDPEQLAQGCDALVLVTDWQHFRNLDYAKLAELMTNPVMIDGRNFLNPEDMAKAGFYYVGIGRPTIANAFLPSSVLPTVTNELLAVS